jgi:hypothetical protein
MTAFQRSVRAKSAAQESAGLSGPTPAVKDAPTIAIERMSRGPDSDCSHALNGSGTASTRVWSTRVR